MKRAHGKGSAPDCKRPAASSQVVTIVERGKPVATMAPAQGQDALRQAARASLLRRLHGQQAAGSRDWTRGEFHKN